MNTLEPDKLKERIFKAEAAISSKLEAIAGNVNHTSERQPIADALANLRVLKREKVHPRLRGVVQRFRTR